MASLKTGTIDSRQTPQLEVDVRWLTLMTDRGTDNEGETSERKTSRLTPSSRPK